MLRFDGEVFLLGTAIAAPLNAWSTTIKIATICASSQQGPFGGSPQAAAGSSRTAAPIARGAASARRSAPDRAEHGFPISAFDPLLPSWIGLGFIAFQDRTGKRVGTECIDLR